MKLKEKGHYYELPLDGHKIQSIIYSGLITLVFNDADSSYLDLHGNFEITRYNQTDILCPRDKGALLLFYDLFEVSIKEVKVDKQGRLFIFFDNGFELTMNEVSPFETWHYTKINSVTTELSLHVHGGNGKLIF